MRTFKVTDNILKYLTVSMVLDIATGNVGGLLIGMMILETLTDEEVQKMKDYSETFKLAPPTEEEYKQWAAETERIANEPNFSPN